ncbi:membrane protein insertion efficiency factor YidD [Lederbergia citri]|uniref:Putative membrane protein insertion efficiency factor n=1 Tax=Lederbergia citri TaxID=2833580 RepID=A0A942TF86_9BACI|nr:membrane protein insertion efficiency factor YidD [Lederbergia citri]MBS4195748.1 membrane protein insertion efficiency factor YidD [Lederbergia citri]
MLSNAVASLLILFVKIYQKFISPIKPKKIKCRFHPTCSNYAISAIRKYGPAVGVKKSINRLWRCRPDNTESCIDYP